MDLKADFAIRNLFRKYEEKLTPEFNEDNWIEFHRTKGGMKALKKSLSLIGSGEITERYEDHLMYVEYFKSNSLILVVHAKLKHPPYYGTKGYYYEIGVYRNNPRSQQIGGGYGTSGIVTIEHTRLLSHGDYDIVHYNHKVVSKVCADIKQYSLSEF